MDNRCEIVKYVVQQLVKSPDAVEVSESETETGIEVLVKVAPEDVGQLIGKRGITANNLRKLVSSLSGEENTRVEIAD